MIQEGRVESTVKEKQPSPTYYDIPCIHITYITYITALT